MPSRCRLIIEHEIYFCRFARQPRKQMVKQLQFHITLLTSTACRAINYSVTQVRMQFCNHQMTVWCRHALDQFVCGRHFQQLSFSSVHKGWLSHKRAGNAFQRNRYCWSTCNDCDVTCDEERYSVHQQFLRSLGPFPKYDSTPDCKISQSIEVTRFIFRVAR